VALVGNPNAGKSTLFNALTGAGAQTGNYPGTTVERLAAPMALPGLGAVQLVDIPGTFSLAARSPEERIAFDTVMGLGNNPTPAALVVVVDAPRLQRSLYLVLQLLDLEIPLVVALNLMDEARATGVAPDPAALSRALGVPVIPTVARTGEGLDALRAALTGALADTASATPGSPHGWSEELARDADEVAAALPVSLRTAAAARRGRSRALALWLLLSVDDDEALRGDTDIPRDVLRRVRARAAAEGRDIEREIVAQRYVWIDAREAAFVTRTGAAAQRATADRIDAVLLHPVWGTLAFSAVMILVFQGLFSWSDPAIGVIEAAFGWIGARVAAGFGVLGTAAPSFATPLGILGDLVVDGIIGGVGSVLVFVPQIGLLFLFVALLEDCGYLARAAHLMDRLLRLAGLPGRAFVPLLSGYACAVPAIMATRTMPRFRDRLLTMSVLPLTSCSARLPVYTLMIAALLPTSVPGWPLPLRPTVLFAIYVFSTLVTLVSAIVLGRTLLPNPASPDLIELPPYRVPHLRTVVRAVVSRVGDFIREAGRVILVTTIVLWALLSFPRYAPEDVLAPETYAAAVAAGADLDALAAQGRLQHSYAGRLGHAIEPVIAPLGMDWRMGIGLIGAFAAREVFVSTMGVVYGIGDVDEASMDLRQHMRDEVRADGRPTYTPLVAMSLMVYFALAFQCLSTLAVLRRESGGWKWPIFISVYMTSLAWIAAFVVYQGGKLLGLT
jgi:ferrous iron transport protein B